MRFSRLLLTAACLPLFATAALANDADFKLHNKTGYQIDEVYVSAHASSKWGRDVMGANALADSESVNITFPHGAGACQFDIKVKYHDDNTTAEWSDINLCKYETISLFYDEKRQVTRVVGE